MYTRQRSEVSLNHVRDQQNDYIPYEKLPFLVQLTVDCNRTAKSCMRKSNLDKTHPEPLKNMPVQCYT